jgi:hypothetical protein
MDIEVSVENAWKKTLADFEEAKKSGDSLLWTEATLRLNFMRRLIEQKVCVDRILAETVYHIGQKDFKPDIIIDYKTESGKNHTAVFELKYFGKIKDWKKDDKT